MPLYEIDENRELVPFRRLPGGPELYEKEIQKLFWENPEEFTGESLFPLAWEPTLPGGGRPDLVLLDAEGRVVVVEVKRDIDRAQLAQCLEYAGWAQTARLDELSAMYKGGPDAFFAAWQDFTGTSFPVTIRSTPRLIMVAGGFHGRTGAALQFLTQNSMAIRWIEVGVYIDERGRRFVDIGGDHEPDLPASEKTEPLSAHAQIDGRRVKLADLLDAGLIRPGDQLIWERPRLGQTFQGELTSNGAILLADGRGPFASPSRAACEAAQIPAYDGWEAWHVGTPDGPVLHELRVRLLESRLGNL